MKKDNKVATIVFLSLGTVLLAVCAVFVNLGIKNPGLPSVKFYIFAGFTGLIGLLFIMGLIAEFVSEKIEKVVLEKGISVKAKVVSAKLILVGGTTPNVRRISYNTPYGERDTEYNNQPVCENASYHVYVELVNGEGKKIKKILPGTFKNTEVSYLANIDSVPLKVYKNHIAFPEGYRESLEKDVPLDIEILSFKNNKIEIKNEILHSLAIKRSKKSPQAFKTKIADYNLYAVGYKSKGDIDTSNRYYGMVKFYYTVGGEKKYRIVDLNITNFSRVQLLQQQGKQLPVLIINNKVYIDFDELPIL